MSFAESSREWWLENGHILHAKCRAENGDDEYVWSQIDLNEFIGNSDGWFQWEGVNFSETASEIRLDGSTLSAELATVDGEPRGRQGIDLNDRLGNQNGQLVFI